jgi:hypothetical protein
MTYGIDSVDWRPFYGRKEGSKGFAILKINSKEQAIELFRKFLQVACERECKLCQL